MNERRPYPEPNPLAKVPAGNPEYYGPMDLTRFRELGLLWAINRYLFHPQGLAITVHLAEDGETVTGWGLIGDGSEPFGYSGEQDDGGFADFEAFLDAYRSNLLPERPETEFEGPA